MPRRPAQEGEGINTIAGSVANAAPEPVIAVSAATKRYGPVLAVDRVDLSVATGEIYALLGLNGAGKTTLIRMLLGMVRPTNGQLSLWGVPVTAEQPTLWGRVGYLVETPAAYPDLSVRENLRLVARLRRLPDTAPVDDAIERLHLGQYADRAARTLSLGNAQRLGLAKALLHRPRLLILDEPANGLDPAGVVEIRELLHGLAEAGTTVLVSSHILAEVAKLATRIGIIHRGRLVRELNAADLASRAQPSLRVSARDLGRARDILRTAGFEPAADGQALVLSDTRALARPDDVATVLVTAGCPPTELVVTHDDLETYFLRTVDAIDHDDA